MRRGTLIALVLLLLVLVGVVAITRSPSATTPVRISVAFVGYTNDAAGSRLARFGFTNQSPFTIMRWDLFSTERRHQLESAPRSKVFIGQRVFLASGQSDIVVVPVPTMEGSWRAVFDCSRDDWQRKFSFWTASWDWMPLRFRRVPVQYAKSDWVDQ